jgi:hypothetical protein
VDCRVRIDGYRVSDTVGMLTASFGLLVAILGLVAWIAKSQAKSQKPDGGRSIYDIVLRIEKRIDRLEKQSDEHLQHHLEGK